MEITVGMKGEAFTDVSREDTAKEEHTYRVVTEKIKQRCRAQFRRGAAPLTLSYMLFPEEYPQG